MSTNFDLWRRELLLTGDIIQDGDMPAPQQERGKRFKRYIEMVEAVSGQEGVETFIVLIESLQAKNDYGAYQNTFGALWRFPPNVAAQGLIAALPGLVERHPDYAGDILARLANATHHEGLAVLSAFRNALRAAPADAQKTIMDFVIREEAGGWLDSRRKGVIRFDGKNGRTWWKFW